jgi:hypothetical protein
MMAIDGSEPPHEDGMRCPNCGVVEYVMANAGRGFTEGNSVRE